MPAICAVTRPKQSLIPSSPCQASSWQIASGRKVARLTPGSMPQPKQGQPAWGNMFEHLASEYGDCDDDDDKPTSDELGPSPKGAQMKKSQKLGRKMPRIFPKISQAQQTKVKHPPINSHRTFKITEVGVEKFNVGSCCQKEMLGYSCCCCCECRGCWPSLSMQTW